MRTRQDPEFVSVLILVEADGTDVVVVSWVEEKTKVRETLMEH